MSASLNNHLNVNACTKVEDVAEELALLQDALGGPSIPNGPTESTVEPVYYDPTGGDDGGPAIIIPSGDGSPSTPVVGNGGTVVGTGGGATYTAGAGIDITGEVIATDNDTTTYLGYSGSGASQQNAILWEDIPQFDDGVGHQVLAHSSGFLRWLNTITLEFTLP